MQPWDIGVGWAYPLYEIEWGKDVQNIMFLSERYSVPSQVF